MRFAKSHSATLYSAVHGGCFRVIRPPFFADLQFLRPGGVGGLHGRDRRARSKQGSGLFLSASGVLGSMVAAAQFLDDRFQLGCVPAQILRSCERSTGRCPSQRSYCSFGPVISTLVDLVEIDGQQAFVAQVLQALVQIRFRVLGNRIHFGIAGKHDVGGVARGRIIADQNRLRLAVFFRGGTATAGSARPNCFQVGRLFLPSAWRHRAETSCTESSKPVPDRRPEAWEK